MTPCHEQHEISNLEEVLAAWACRVVKEKTMNIISYIKLQYDIIQAVNWKISGNYSGRHSECSKNVCGLMKYCGQFQAVFIEITLISIWKNNSEQEMPTFQHHLPKLHKLTDIITHADSSSDTATWCIHRNAMLLLRKSYVRSELATGKWGMKNPFSIPDNDISIWWSDKLISFCSFICA